MWNLLVYGLTSPALACGGFFCDTQAPVLQAAERVVFGVDDDLGEVEMHVQITYEGASEDFAWIVPVPENPEIFLTTGALFTQVATLTLPNFTLDVETEGECKTKRDRGGDDSGGFRNSDSAVSTSFSAPSSPGGANVISQEAVGPYLTTVLQAETVEDLMTWLEDNAYEVPRDLAPLLDPYLQQDSYFVALKLLKDKDAGDLTPLAMRWAADTASIPVQLTAVAAAPDMRMEAYVLGDGRGVPESYLHVQINEAAIDWWNVGANYNDVITQAANEAGGHAFATDFHGPTDFLGEVLYREGSYDRGAMEAATSATNWAEMAVNTFSTVPPELAIVVEDQIDLPSGVTGASFVQCVGCFDVDDPDFDPVAATDDFEVRVLEPSQVAQRMLDRFGWMSRMTSSLDAAEMTVDPTFVLNRDLRDEPVSQAHSALLVTECNKRTLVEDALQRLELVDGRVLYLPSAAWMAENNTTPFEFLEEHGELAAQVIEQMSSSGQPEVVVDHTDDLMALANDHNDWVHELMKRGCGCSSSGLAGGWAVGLVGLMGVARRRQSRRS